MKIESSESAPGGLNAKMRKSSEGEKYRNTRGRRIPTAFGFPSDRALRNVSNVKVVY